MNILKEFNVDSNCSYLAELKQTTYYKIIENCSTIECQELIERGFRRFGKMFFRPVCATCSECQSIKIDVKNFEFSKSQRRVLKKGVNIRTFLQRPNLSQEHLDLFNKYHTYMKETKGWEHNGVDSTNYHSSFVDGANNFGYEVLYYDEDKLVGIDLVDILEDGISSIYFYYDPDYASYSLGKLSLYKQIQYAQKANLKWIYLGYYVEGCPSLSYKSHYKPYLTLSGQPNLDEEFKYA